MNWNTKEEATAAAKKAKAKMRIGRWKVHVFENLGWHVSLTWGCFGFSYYNRPSNEFGLLVGYGGTGISGVNHYFGSDPNDMMKQAFKDVPNQLKYWTDIALWLQDNNPKRQPA